MKKEIIRREYIKLRIAGKDNKECLKILQERYGIDYDKRTLRRWWKRFNNDDNWDLKDTSQKPHKLPIKFYD